jgi:hypothetical protein
MIVFEGYAGKSLAVVEYLESLKDDKPTVIIDGKIGGSWWGCTLNPESIPYELDYFSMKDSDGWIMEDIDVKEVISKYKRVVLYLNVKKDDIEYYKERVEKRYGVDVILTVQTHDESPVVKEGEQRFNVKKYEV